MAALSLMPIWVLHVRAGAHRAARGGRPVRSASAPRCTAALPVLPRRRRRGRRRPPVRRRRGPADVPPHRGPAALRLLRHRRSTTSAGIDVYGDPEPRGRPPRDRVVRSDAGPGPERRRRAHRRRDPRRRLPRALHARRGRPDERRVRRGVRELVLGGGADRSLAARGGRVTRSTSWPRGRGHSTETPTGEADRDRSPIGDAPVEGTPATRVSRPLRRPTSSSSAAGRRARRPRYWLARHGHDVTVVEKQDVPPREDVRRRADAARGQAARRHGPRRRARRSSTASTACGPPAWAASSSCEWPTHPVYPQHGYVVRRRDLDQMVADNAVAAGATLLEGHEAVHADRRPRLRPRRHRARPRRRRPARRAAPSITIVADGANSRFGRALGTSRTREWPYGTAIRTYWRVAAPRRPVDRVGPRRQGPQRQPDARLRVDLPGRRRHGEHRRRAAVDVPRLQERQHDPPARRLRPPDRRALGDRRRPARRAGRRAGASRWAARSDRRPGPTYLVVGDAAGSVNPFNGEGIDYAYETGADGGRRGPRGARRPRRRRRCSATRSCSTTSTASTSRSPACSPG